MIGDDFFLLKYVKAIFLYFQTSHHATAANSGARTTVAFRHVGVATATRTARTALTRTTARPSPAPTTSSIVPRVVRRERQSASIKPDFAMEPLIVRMVLMNSLLVVSSIHYLHYITLYYITLHYITLHYIILKGSKIIFQQGRSIVLNIRHF